MSFKASDLVKIKQKSDDLSEYNYKVQLDKCFTHIKNVHKNCKNDDFTFFNIPLILYDDPNYNYSKCTDFILKKLKESEFYAIQSHSNTNSIYISWKKNDVLKIKKELDEIKQLKIEQQHRLDLEKKAQENRKKQQQIKWKPSSAISEMKMKSALMKDNPKYTHLKNAKKK